MVSADLRGAVREGAVASSEPMLSHWLQGISTPVKRRA